LGIFASFVGALGLLRLPDAYTRMHAATVSVIGGAVVTVFGLALFLGASNPISSLKVLIIAAVIFFTSPVGSHAILRAAHKSRVPLWPRSVCDMLKEGEKDV
jgi:multicomponent Na+:H+ antiporter subunit G